MHKGAPLVSADTRGAKNATIRYKVHAQIKENIHHGVELGHIIRAVKYRLYFRSPSQQHATYSNMMYACMHAEYAYIGVVFIYRG